MAKVLIIDDDPQFRSMLVDMVSREGHQVTSAEDGIQGVESVQRSSFDLVLTDILMPKQDGIETILQIQTLRPGLPIVAMSGGRRSVTAHFNLDSAALLGVKQTLAKPFTRQQLVSAIQGALG